MNKNGFSLAEMMVVMLILSIVLAAATPIITKRVIARANEATEQTSSNPTGSIIAYAGVVPPDGWLLCNGQSTSGYPELAAIVGANVPDLRGEFIRGWDNGRGLDSGRVFGSFQEDMIKSHIHKYFAFRYDSGPRYDISGNYQGYTANGNSIYYWGPNWPTDAFGGTETRPRNIALNYIIKH